MGNNEIMKEIESLYDNDYGDVIEKNIDQETKWGVRVIYPLLCVKGAMSTGGIGGASTPVLAYHYALTSAKIEWYNLVPVSSVLPKKCPIAILDKPNIKRYVPSGILFTIESRQIISPKDVRPNRLAFAALTVSEMYRYKLVLEWHDIIKVKGIRNISYERAMYGFYLELKDYFKRFFTPPISRFFVTGIFFDEHKNPQYTFMLRTHDYNWTHYTVEPYGQFNNDNYIALVNELVLNVELI